jgi:prepilin-type processing-associated H-X9-DG protein
VGRVTVAFADGAVGPRERGELEQRVAREQADEALSDRAGRAEDCYLAPSHTLSVA